jgi:hypothetical protein
MSLSFFRRLGRPAGPHPAPAPPAPHGRAVPHVEPLEPRWLPSAVGGAVYDDLNHNGLLDPGEHGIANNTIQLYNAAGALLGTTTTDANGRYQFNLDPTIDTSPKTEEVDADFTPAKTDFSQTQGIPQFNPALGTLTSLDIISDGTLTSAIKVESLDSAPGNVTGTVSGILTLQAPGVAPLSLTPSTAENTVLGAYDGGMDFAGTSGFDFGAKSASGSRTVTLTAGTDDLSAFTGTGTVNLTESAQATSSASGPGNLLSLINSTASGHVRVVYHYTPGNALGPGTYTVVQPQVPSGFLPGQTTGDNVTPLPWSPPPESIPVALGTTDSLNNNFGELEPSSLSGFVYLDADRDGVKEPAEPGVPGVAVTLNGTDYLGNPVSQAQQTGPDGSYAFGNLRPGLYTLLASQPAGYLPGSNSVGSLGGTVNGNQMSVNVPAGVAGANYNFAELLPPRQQDQVPTPGTPSAPPIGDTPQGPPGPGAPLSKRDFIGNAWESWGW